MESEKLNLSSLIKATLSFETVLKLPKTDISRDAAIQRFEYTYELAWKMMKRHLEWTGASNINLYSKRDLFREAFKANLISDPNNWFEFNEARNVTSHAYEESAANETYDVAKKFLPEVQQLVRILSQFHA